MKFKFLIALTLISNAAFSQVLTPRQNTPGAGISGKNVKTGLLKHDLMFGRSSEEMTIANPIDYFDIGSPKGLNCVAKLGKHPEEDRTFFKNDKFTMKYFGQKGPAIEFIKLRFQNGQIVADVELKEAEHLFHLIPSEERNYSFSTGWEGNIVVVNCRGAAPKTKRIVLSNPPIESDVRNYGSCVSVTSTSSAWVYRQSTTNYYCITSTAALEKAVQKHPSYIEIKNNGHTIDFKRCLIGILNKLFAKKQ